MMNILMKSLMISCKKSSELIEKDSVFKLTWAERQKLNIHKRMCGVCNTYFKQSKWLDTMLHQHNHDEYEKIKTSENKELKEKIISEL